MLDLIDRLKSRRRLNKLGYRRKKDFTFRDEVDGELKVDRLVLHRDGISLIIYMPYEGNIFCAEGIDAWTQMLNGKSFTFQNPLIELDYLINTVAREVSVPVDGYLYFGHRADFPRGKPERVIRYDCVPARLLPARNNRPEQAVIEAWERLLQQKV